MPQPPLNATVLYQRNGTTVDTGAGIDIRAIDDVNGGGAGDQTQTVGATHTQDGALRCFDPGSHSTASEDASVLQKKGWAIPLADFTPSDARCNGFLPAGSATVFALVALSWTDSPLNNSTIGLVGGLFRYNPSTDAGTLIATASGGGVTWNFSSENGTEKTLTAPFSWASPVTFESGETLLLQIGLVMSSLGNPLTGTVTYTGTLRIDVDGTNLTWDTLSLRNLCQETFAGSATPVAVLQRRFVRKKALAATATPVAATRRLVRKTVFTSTATPVATSRKMVKKPFAATVTPEAALFRRRIFKTIAATVTPIAVLFRIAYAIKRSSSVTPTGILHRRRITKSPLTGTVTPTATARRQIEKVPFTGTVTPQASGRIEVPLERFPTGGGGGDTIIRKILQIFDD